MIEKKIENDSDFVDFVSEVFTYMQSSGFPKSQKDMVERNIFRWITEGKYAKEHLPTLDEEHIKDNLAFLPNDYKDSNKVFIFTWSDKTRKRTDYIQEIFKACIRRSVLTDILFKKTQNEAVDYLWCEIIHAEPNFFEITTHCTKEGVVAIEFFIEKVKFCHRLNYKTLTDFLTWEDVRKHYNWLKIRCKINNIDETERVHE